jgi:hypothetical protein
MRGAGSLLRLLMPCGIHFNGRALLNVENVKNVSECAKAAFGDLTFYTFHTFHHIDFKHAIQIPPPDVVDIGTR